MSLTPTTGRVVLGMTQQFTAAVTNAANTGVTWQSAGSRSEVHIPFPTIAVPQARSAVDTLLAVKGRDAVVAACDRLSRAHLDA